MTSDYGVVTAFDLGANRRLWRYVPKLGVANPCCGPVNRGVALGLGSVFVGTLDARLVALDADSGTLHWEVVNSDADSAYSITMAPLVVGDRVIVGTSGGEFATRGNVTAYDARTGKRLWRWYAIPSPEQGGWWGRWWEPLCYAQIGGLTVATFVTLILVPVLYAIFVLDLKIVKWEKVEGH